MDESEINEELKIKEVISNERDPEKKNKSFLLTNDIMEKVNKNFKFLNLSTNDKIEVNSINLDDIVENKKQDLMSYSEKSFLDIHIMNEEKENSKSYKKYEFLKFID